MAPAGQPPELLGSLLRRVSRTFWLSLSILPRSLREPIGLAYLLARAADTIADTRLIPRTERLEQLRAFRGAVAGERDAGGAFVGPHASARGAEGELLERIPEAVARIGALHPLDAESVRAVLATITTGQVGDLEHFPGEDAGSLAALGTMAELDQYTYQVAGCVGEFWTVIHVRHRPALSGWNAMAMSAEGVRFGKALQMTNVLRDIPADLGSGRCYLPADELAALSLEPRDLLDPSCSPRAIPLLRRLLARTLADYDAGWRYTLAIPQREWRMRLACAWPLLLGFGTLAALAAHPNPLAADTAIKLSRREVRRLIARSMTRVWWNHALAAEARRLRPVISA